MKTVAIDARLIAASGLGRFIKNLIATLRGSEFSLTLLGFEKDAASLDSFQPKEIIWMKSPIYSINEQFELMRKIPKVDLFLSPHFNIPLLAIRAKKRMVVIHDVYHLTHQDEFSLVERLYAKMMYRQAVLRSDCVVAVSQFSKEEILRHLTQKKKTIHVIHNAIDFSLFAPCHDETLKAAVREKYHLPTHFVLAVGNVKPHKNLKRLIEAVEGTLVIVGKREGFHTPVEAIENERILWLGEIDDGDLAILYSMASLLAFPSLYEGFGLPPIEAMAVGCPVVASHAACLPEILNDAPLYFNPQNVEEMKKAILRVKTEPQLQREMIRKGFLQAANYSMDKKRESFIRLFNNLIE